MRIGIFMICMSLLISAAAIGQSDSPDKSVEMPAPPPPIEDEILSSMVGEWEGWTKSPMGESKDWMKCRMDLNGQFLLMEFKAVLPGGAPYQGKGLLTYGEDGKVIGYWFDSWRSVSQGVGHVEGNKTIVNWSSSMGNQTRITEMAGPDKMKTIIKMTGPDGKPAEGYGEMMRIK